MEIRDPIHGFIHPEPIEQRIIDTKVFQRLRRLRQLALASYVYPGALHTRFEHSIGALHVARMLSRTLLDSDTDRRLVCLAALLHDIGHGPFSHVSEPILEEFAQPTAATVQGNQQIHELISWNIIQRNKELEFLISGEEREHIVQLLQGKYGYSIFKDIVSGPLDADKQDYLLRDSYFCGVKYGVFDIDRLREVLVPHRYEDDVTLALSSEGIHPVEQFVLAKYYMTTQVYRHRIRLITDEMISRGIKLGITEDKINWLKDIYAYDGSDAFINEYLNWHDERLFMEILNRAPKDTYAHRVFTCVRDRKLFKLIFSATERDFSDPVVRNRVFGENDSFLRPLEEKIATTYGMDKNLVIAHKIKFKSAMKTESEIVVLRAGGPKIFRDQSVLFSSVNQSILEQYVQVYAPVEHADEKDKKKKKRQFESEILKMIEDLTRPAETTGPEGLAAQDGKELKR